MAVLDKIDAGGWRLSPGRPGICAGEPRCAGFAAGFGRAGGGAWRRAAAVAYRRRAAVAASRVRHVADVSCVPARAHWVVVLVAHPDTWLSGGPIGWIPTGPPPVRSDAIASD